MFRRPSTIVCMIPLLFITRTESSSRFLPPKKTDAEVSVEDGKKHYLSLSHESELPKYGPCWKEALNNLHTDCKTLSDDVQSRLALSFTHCFLSKAGLESEPCQRTEEIRTCVRRLDDKGFNTYSNFFTHTHSMCCFLQSQVWHEETDNLISRLSENSANVSRHMKQSYLIQLELMETQKKSIDTQEKLWNKGHELSKILESSKQSVREVLSEFKSSTDEQRLLIMEVFDRVSSLQSILLGEFTGFYCMIFYTVAGCVVFLITSTPRTNGARFWLFFILMASALIERSIVAWGLVEEVNLHVDELTSIIYNRIWLCRKVSSFVAFVVLAVVCYRYKDFNMINNQLLMEIKEQNLEMRRFIQSKVSNDIHNSEPIDKYISTRDFITDNIGNGIKQDINDSSNDLNKMDLDDETNVQPLDWPNLPVTPVKTRQLSSRINSAERSPHGYNLRKRSSNQLIVKNPIVDEETPQQFSETINILSAKSKIASKKIRSLLHSQQLNWSFD